MGSERLRTSHDSMYFHAGRTEVDGPVDTPDPRISRSLAGLRTIQGMLARRRRMAGISFATLAALLLLGCAEPRVSLRQGPREYTARDYDDVLRRWTRSESLLTLEDLDDKLTVTATYESWDFRWAYVVRYAKDYRLTVEQRTELMDRTLKESHDTHEFFVALYGSNRRWTDLTKPTSSWVVRLIDEDGNETAPLRIEGIAKPGPIERRYFPYTTVWRQAYRVRFPKSHAGRDTISTSARWFGLRFAGAEGSQELRWQVHDPEGRPTIVEATKTSVTP